MLSQDSAKRSSSVILIVGLGLMAIGGQRDENELIVQENMKKLPPKDSKSAIRYPAKYY